ncbi:tRNA (adenosine(37)-N6)-threonylcarbamoyltransferase complex ATPase subunit type 1 TsaE [Holzapfeliella sp. He02]|uniref:tRNA threonylcarbamoyladenosine biosynthesis protein TsaE n=1 Tax=Holzapfeliella saturejae TaxID=3082953 RepID=A0ABU8SFY0_9LACO
MQFVTQDESQTMAFGKQLGKLVTPKTLILLDGDLGAGKTTLTKGIASALGIKRPIKSPTFTIVREYLKGRLPLFHMDMYRLEDGDMSSIDLPAYFDQGSVIVMEWSVNILDQLPDDYLRIKIERLDNEIDSTKRQFTLEAVGDKNNQLIEELKKTSFAG